MSRLAAALARVPAPVMAAALMTLAMFLAALGNIMVRHVTQELPPFQVQFLRNLFLTLFLLSVLPRTGLSVLRTRRHGMMAMRALVMMGQLGAWFYALKLLPVDKATALNFTVPLWAVIGAALFLRERIGPRRWAAVAVGVLGSLVIVRPGLATFEPASVFALLAAALMAVSLLQMKSLSRTDSALTVVLYLGIYGTPLSLLPALLVWQTPEVNALLITAAMGLFSALTHMLMVRALALADASAMAPLDFVRLPFGALLGWLWFGELMDLWSWIGAAIIVIGITAVSRREAARPD
jgi:drug/metabolite transporter (DMT)-like permease